MIMFFPPFPTQTHTLFLTLSLSRTLANSLLPTLILSYMPAHQHTPPPHSLGTTGAQVASMIKEPAFQNLNKFQSNTVQNDAAVGSTDYPRPGTEAHYAQIVMRRGRKIRPHIEAFVNLDLGPYKESVERFYNTHSWSKEDYDRVQEWREWHDNQTVHVFVYVYTLAHVYMWHVLIYVYLYRYVHVRVHVRIHVHMNMYI